MFGGDYSRMKAPLEAVLITLAQGTALEGGYGRLPGNE